jgi:ankyrin repeat protein
LSSILTLKKLHGDNTLDSSKYLRLKSCNHIQFVGLCATGMEHEACRLLDRFPLKDSKFNKVLGICTKFAQGEADGEEIDYFEQFCKQEIGKSSSALLNVAYRKALTLALVKRMIATGVVTEADPNQIFHCACYIDDAESAKILISIPGVDPAENDGDTFGICCEEGFLDIVKIFLEDLRVDPSADDNYAIQGAAENGHLDILNILLADPRTDPTPLENYAIGAACESGHVDIVLRLLQDPRVDPADDDNYAFKTTVGASIPEETIVRILEILMTDGRVNPLIDDCEVAEKAASHGQALVLKYLMTIPGMRLSNSALVNAAEFGHLECVQYLLTFPDINPNDPEIPAIIAPCRKGQTEIVRLLLQDQRVDPSIKSNYCIRAACHYKHAEITKLLLAHPDVDFSYKDYSAIKYMVKNRWLFIYNSIPRSKLADFAVHKDLFNRNVYNFSCYVDSDFFTDDSESDNSENSWESDISSDFDDDDSGNESDESDDSFD